MVNYPVQQTDLFYWEFYVIKHFAKHRVICYSIMLWAFSVLSSLLLGRGCNLRRAVCCRW